MKSELLSSIQRPKKTWILIADGARARIFLAHPHYLENALNMDIINDHLPSQKAVADKPGRALENDHVSKHTLESHSDWYTYKKQVFAQEICKIISKAYYEHKFQSLIIVAPPKTLGELRQNLPNTICRIIKSEIPKDITKMNSEELLPYLSELVVL